MIKNNEAIPFRAFHVGEYVRERLEDLDMTQAELSRLSGINKPIVNDILKGRRGVTAEQSAILGKALEVPDDYFWKLQARYEIDKARISKKVQEQNAAQGIWDIMKAIVSIPALKKCGVVLLDNVRSDVERVFEVFGVSNLDGLVALRTEPANDRYRKSEILKTDENALFTWKYLCIHRSSDIKLTQPFDKGEADRLTGDLNAIFRENKEVVRRVGEVLSRYGIKFVAESKYGQVPVDGLSFWKGDNPTIAVTLRHDRIDIFAFTIFHELGHIMLHLSKDNGEAINPDDERNSRLEKEADDFAQRSLIPQEMWRSFERGLSNQRYGTLGSYINEFSDKNGINPRILYGRYCHEAANFRHRVNIPYKLT